MKKILILFLTLLVPLFLFIEIWGVFRYNEMKQEVSRLEKEQDYWIDQNKKAVMGIAFHTSPERVSAIAKEDPRLSEVDQEDVLRIDFVPRSGK